MSLYLYFSLLFLNIWLLQLLNLSSSLIAYLREIDHNQDILRTEGKSNTKKRAFLRVQQVLIAAQEIGDEKLQVVQMVHDLIENKTKRFDLNFLNLGIKIFHLGCKKSFKIFFAFLKSNLYNF